MKLRHVRAVALAGVVLVALTGARGSHGGSCGGGSSHGSGTSGGTTTSGGDAGSGSYGGGSTGGYSSGTTSSGGYTSGTTSSGSDSSSTSTGGYSGGSTTSGVTGGSSSSKPPMREVRMDSCKASDVSVTAKFSVTNSSPSTTYNYRFTLHFTGPDGQTVGGMDRNPSIMMVRPGATESWTTSQTIFGKPQAGTYRCEITNVVRTAN